MAIRSANRASSSYSGNSGGRFLSFRFGVFATLIALFAGGWIDLHYGHAVAAADPSFPMEAQIVHVPLEARIQREMQQPPFGTSEDVFESGAKLYVNQCAGCHGVPGKDADFAKWMYPKAPQLWKKHARGNVVGVSDDEPGETFWKIKNGIRLTGMPAYEHILSPTQMWQISLLLKNADQPLPDPVHHLLTQ